MILTSYIQWTIVVYIGAGVVFHIIGSIWESGILRPKHRKLPTVSIIIPAYFSSKTIAKCLRSAIEADYPKKETIVINDSDDETPSICRRYGISCVQNSSRLGKSKALSKGIELAKGEIIFLLDSDTIIDRNAIKECVSWFSDKSVAAVQLRYIPQNSHSLISGLTYLEHYFTMSFFKSSMFCGTILGFRGCAMAIRRSSIHAVGGWKETMAEDLHMCAKLVKAGYRVQYEPRALARTMEPESMGELAKQRTRWGKGAIFTFLSHYSLYLKSPQFFIYIFPYIMALVALLDVFILEPHLYFSSVSIVSDTSEDFTFSIASIIARLFAGVFGPLGLASMIYIGVLVYPEKGKMMELALLPLYILFYVPFITAFYAKGIISGLVDKKKEKTELNLDEW